MQELINLTIAAYNNGELNLFEAIELLKIYGFSETEAREILNK